MIYYFFKFYYSPDHNLREKFLRKCKNFRILTPLNRITNIGKSKKFIIQLQLGHLLYYHYFQVFGLSFEGDAKVFNFRQQIYFDKMAKMLS